MRPEGPPPFEGMLSLSMPRQVESTHAPRLTFGARAAQGQLLRTNKVALNGESAAQVAGEAGWDKPAQKDLAAAGARQRPGGGLRRAATRGLEQSASCAILCRYPAAPAATTSFALLLGLRTPTYVHPGLPARPISTAPAAKRVRLDCCMDRAHACRDVRWPGARAAG